MSCPGTWVIKTLGHSSTWSIRTLEAHSDTQDLLFSKLLDAISSYYTTLLSNCVDYIRKQLSPFVFLLQKKRRGMEKTIDFAAPLLDLPLIYLLIDNSSLGSSEKLNVCYNYKKERHLTTEESISLVRLRNSQIDR